MATTRQKVQIDLTAVDKTKAAFNSVNSSLEKTAKSAALLRKAFSGFIAVGAIAAGISAFSKAALAAQQPLIDMAELIGANIAEMSKLGTAAELAGISQTKFTTGLQRQTRRVAEAAAGTGEAVKALKELGLEAQRLNTLRPDEQFREIAEAMGDIPNRADQVRLAMKLWDSEGVALLNTMNKLEEATKIAVESGAVLTDQEVQAFKELREEVAKTEAAYKALGQTVVSTGIAAEIESWKQKTLEWASTVAEVGSNTFTNLGKFADVFKSKLFGSPEEQSAAFKALAESLWVPVVEGADAAGDAVLTFDLKLKQTGNTVKSVKDDMDLMFDAVENQFKQLEQNTALNEVGLGPQQARELRQFNEEKRKAAQEEIEAQRELQKETDATLRSQQQFADNVASTMTSAFSDAVIDAQSLSSVFDALLQDLAQMVIRMAILRPLAQSISSGIQPFLPQFATGTNSAPGGFAVVGEQGPEVVNLPRGSQVIPNNKLGNGGGDTVVNVVNAPPDTRVEETRQADGSALINVILAEVGKSITGGGLVGRSIQQSFGTRVQAVTR
jgi:hypothetical protein